MVQVLVAVVLGIVVTCTAGNATNYLSGWLGQAWRYVWHFQTQQFMYASATLLHLCFLSSPSQSMQLPGLFEHRRHQFHSVNPGAVCTVCYFPS
jgi:hypothetical protein